MAPTFSLTGRCRAYRTCPVWIRMDKLDAQEAALTATDLATRRAYPLQVEACPVTGERYAVMLLDSIEKGETRRFALGAGRARTRRVRVAEADERRVEVRIGRRLLTAYYFAGDVARPFLHPLSGPHGEPVTRGFPMIPDVPGETQDHVHHKSCWVAWGDVNETDNWSETAGHGCVAHQRFERTAGGPVLGRIRARNHWTTGEGRKLMEETRDMIFYRMRPAGRAIDLMVRFNATEGPVRFGDTKEGGIASVRVATCMDGNKGGLIENANGCVTEAETWGKRAAWCDYSGAVAGRSVGVAILDHPGNFRHPTYWHVRDYGLMTANPFGRSHFTGDKERDGSYTLGAGDTLTFRYRIFIHSGDAARGRVAAEYQNYINPPSVEVE